MSSPGVEDHPLKIRLVHTYKEYCFILIQPDRPIQPGFQRERLYIATLEVACILSHHADFPETLKSFSVSSMMLCTLHMWSHVNFITSVGSIRYNVKVQVGEVTGDYLGQSRRK